MNVKNRSIESKRINREIHSQATSGTSESAEGRKVVYDGTYRVGPSTQLSDTPSFPFQVGCWCSWWIGPHFRRAWKEGAVPWCCQWYQCQSRRRYCWPGMCYCVSSCESFLTDEQEGIVYAVEFSPRSGRDLIGMAKKRTNVIRELLGILICAHTKP